MANKPDLADFFMAEGCTFSLHRQNDNRLLITLGDDSGSARDRLFLKEALRLRDTLNLMYPKEEFN